MRTIVIIFSSHSEWRAARKCCKVTFVETTPFGECFALLENERTLIYLEGGWGKISAAASAQYAIVRWKPDLVINLMTARALGLTLPPSLLLARRPDHPVAVSDVSRTTLAEFAISRRALLTFREEARP